MHVSAVTASVIKRSVLSGDDLIMYARVRVKRKARRSDKKYQTFFFLVLIFYAELQCCSAAAAVSGEV
jgi:hypothetical protein